MGGISALCPRCGFKLARGPVASAAHPNDAGVSLDSFDQPRPTATSVAASVREAPQGGDAAVELRRLGHKLRPALRVDRHFGDWPKDDRWATRAGATGGGAPALSTIATDDLRDDPQRANTAAWGIRFLLTVGMLTLLAGVASLAWSTASGDPLASQWGVTASIAGEGLLVIALARITLRLWRNGRRLVVQLEGVRGHLEQLERHGGPLPLGCAPISLGRTL
jgi:hypothetical protein